MLKSFPIFPGKNMTLPYKIKIAKAVTNILNKNLDFPIEKIASKVRVHPFFNHQHSFVIAHEAHLNDPTYAELEALKRNLNYKVEVQYLFRKPYIAFLVDQQQFQYDVLSHRIEDTFSYRTQSKLLIEFSSPNIGKQFHLGHLRSTAVGNFLTNICKFAKNEVVTMTYLGDWGMQFGILKAGIEKCNLTLEEILEKPLEKLHEAYTVGNLKNDDYIEIEKKASEIIREYEFIDENHPGIKEWHSIHSRCEAELKEIYKKLSIHFDHYSWESHYSSRKIQPLIDELKAKEIIVPEADQSLVAWVEDQLIPFIKFDGCTLYLARDVAAALDRYEKFKFDKTYYVVDTMQRGHYVALVRILEKLGADCASKIEYVPYGRVTGVGPHNEKVVWLNHIFDEARRMIELKKIQSLCKDSIISDDVAEILGITSLLINDLKRNRMRHYNFRWKEATNTEGYSGVKLQFCHCRLCNLIESCDVSLPSHCNPKLLQEPQAVAVIHNIARFEDALIDGFERFESCFLVSYLFDLSDSVNKAIKVLKLKDIPSEVASQRLLLFVKSKEILNFGMKLLGIKPLDQI